MLEHPKKLACILLLMMIAAAAILPRTALASDLEILAKRMGDEVIDLSHRPNARSMLPDREQQDETGAWIRFDYETSPRIAQVSEYHIAPKPNDDGTIDVIVRTTLINTTANYAEFTTTKTIYCDGRRVAYIGPDYRRAETGESISQEAHFTVSGGGSHRVTSTETEFREGTETATGWDFTVDAPFVISASASTGGSIEPNGSAFVYESDSHSYQIEAYPGYRISDVIVDGKHIGARGQYSFVNVNENHSIEARFTKTWNVTFVDGIDGSVIEHQVIDDGQDARKPLPPVHTGYRFDGWSSTVSDIRRDATIVANYIQTHSVVFLDHDGHELSRQTIDHQDAAEDPGIPPRQGYASTGWDTAFSQVTEDLVISPTYEPLVVVCIPALVACTIMPDGTVMAPQGYEIKNQSLVPVQTSGIMARDIVPNVDIELLDENGPVYATGRHSDGIHLDVKEARCFTWHVSDLNPQVHGDLIAKAVLEPTPICSIQFTFEAAI